MSETKDVLSFLKHLEQNVTYNLTAIKQTIKDLEETKESTGVDRLRARAMALYFAGYDAKARSAMNALVAVEPTERSLNKLAQLENRNGAYERAKVAAERAISLDKGSVLGYQNLAAAQLGLGDSDAALEAAEMAFKLDQRERSAALVAVARSLKKAPRSDAEVSILSETNPGLEVALRDLIGTEGTSSIFMEGDPVQNSIDYMLRAEPTYPLG
jgi:tetratricopeptide (TPR) repeat protein